MDACPRQLKWAKYPELCLGTMHWHVGNGQPIVLASCEEAVKNGPRQHWLFTSNGKIQLSSSPSYCHSASDMACFTAGIDRSYAVAYESQRHLEF